MAPDLSNWPYRWFQPLRRLLRGVPTDLVALSALVAVSYAFVVDPKLQSDLFQAVFGLLLVLFAPGYALVAVLFPRESVRSRDVGDSRSSFDSGDSPTEGNAGDSPTERTGARSVPEFAGRSVTWTERVALSFGASIAISPLVGLLLDLTRWGIRLVPAFVGIGGVTLVLTVIAAARRLRLPPEVRLTVPFGDWIARTSPRSRYREDRVGFLLTVALAVSLLAAGASIAHTVTEPRGSVDFTELYLLTENETGQLVTDGYPTEMTTGNASRLHVGVTNHENRRVSYTVVVELQRVDVLDGSAVVRDQEQLYRARQSVGPNGTWFEPVSVTPNLTGRHLRLAVLVYTGQPPSNPTVENAYREGHLWVNVTDGSPRNATAGADATNSSRKAERT